MNLTVDDRLSAGNRQPLPPPFGPRNRLARGAMTQAPKSQGFRGSASSNADLDPDGGGDSVGCRRLFSLKGWRHAPPPITTADAQSPVVEWAASALAMNSQMGLPNGGSGCGAPAGHWPSERYAA